MPHFSGIRNRVVAIAQRGELSAKKALAPEETRRLDQLEKDLMVSNAKFEQFLTELPQHLGAKPVVLAGFAGDGGDHGRFCTNSPPVTIFTVVAPTAKPPCPSRCSRQRLATDGARSRYSDGSQSRRTSITLDISLVTVLHGGGAIAGYSDEITPFRPSSIRGHRFWWRATRGAEYNTWQALRKHEDVIFGDTDQQSPVRIRVDCPDALKPKRIPLRRYEKDLYRRYALFPSFEDKRKDLDRNRLLEGGGFRFTVSVHDSQLVEQGAPHQFCTSTTRPKRDSDGPTAIRTTRQRYPAVWLDRGCELGAKGML